MPSTTTELHSPVNHVFVDYENVHEVDLTIIGNKAVHFMLLMGARQTKLDAALVEKLLEHAASVQLVRLASSGKNALDFTLAYYLGRAVAAEPAGFFHIVSKDAGYDPMIEHLINKRIRVRRHESFETLTFGQPAKPAPAAPATVPKAKLKSPAKPKAPVSVLSDRATQVLEHLRKPKASRPKNQERLIRHVVALLGHKIIDNEALTVIQDLQRAGYLGISDKGVINYFIE